MINEYDIKNVFVSEYNEKNPGAQIDLHILNEYIADMPDHDLVKDYKERSRQIKFEMIKDKKDSYEVKIFNLLKDGSEVLNKKINTCPLCFISNKLLDAGIFLLNWGHDEVNDYLEYNEIPVIIDADKLAVHKKHLYVYNKDSSISEEVRENLDKITELSNFDDVTDVQILNSRINTLTLIISKLEAEGLTWRKEYKDANDSLQRFIEIKNKITDGDKIKIEGKLDIADIIHEIVNKK